MTKKIKNNLEEIIAKLEQVEDKTLPVKIDCKEFRQVFSEINKEENLGLSEYKEYWFVRMWTNNMGGGYFNAYYEGKGGDKPSNVRTVADAIEIFKRHIEWIFEDKKFTYESMKESDNYYWGDKDGYEYYKFDVQLHFDNNYYPSGEEVVEDNIFISDDTDIQIHDDHVLMIASEPWA